MRLNLARAGGDSGACPGESSGAAGVRRQLGKPLADVSPAGAETAPGLVAKGSVARGSAWAASAAGWGHHGRARRLGAAREEVVPRGSRGSPPPWLRRGIGRGGSRHAGLGPCSNAAHLAARSPGPDEAVRGGGDEKTAGVAGWGRPAQSGVEGRPPVLRGWGRQLSQGWWRGGRGLAAAASRSASAVGLLFGFLGGLLGL